MTTSTPGEPVPGDRAADGAVPAAEPTAASEPTQISEPTQVSIRRAPRLGVFLVLGAMLGLLATLILTSLYPVQNGLGFGTLFGYFSLFGVPAGTLVGALVGLVADRLSRRRARTVTVQRESVEGPPLEGELED